jgi:hypothetical protein
MATSSPLAVGSDDGAARTYDVHVDWDGAAAVAATAIESVEIAVRDVRFGSA